MCIEKDLVKSKRYIVDTTDVAANVNYPSEKKLQELVEKVEQDLEIKPEGITTDKAYGTASNRAYLKDNEIISNIAFYKESSREQNYYGLKDFNISEDLISITCPNGIITEEYVMRISLFLSKKAKNVYGVEVDLHIIYNSKPAISKLEFSCLKLFPGVVR